MRTLFMGPRELKKWQSQNKAVCSGDFCDGCLLDNFVLFCKRGVAAVYEHYVGPWSSNYRVEFEPYPANQVWKHWYRFEEERS